VTELVTRAETAGLLDREQSADDARVYWLHLTGEGEQRLANTVARIGRERQRLLELLASEAA
jgi:DNA-binding MarR family transcriptional regulator